MTTEGPGSVRRGQLEVYKEEAKVGVEKPFERRIICFFLCLESARNTVSLISIYQDLVGEEGNRDCT